MSRERIYYDEGLSIINPKIREKVNIQFYDFTDEETICFILSKVCGWSYNRIASLVKISRPTVRRRIESAVKKRKRA